MFKPTVYEERRRALASSLAGRGVVAGLVAFTGNRDSPMNYADNAYPSGRIHASSTISA